MSRLRCFEQNNGREKIIELVKYSREQCELKCTGTDIIQIKELSAYDVCREHYNQSRSYIERIQATIPGFTAKKIAAIRNGLNEI